MYLGIDLGTSNSVIAGIVDGKVKVFRPADGGETLPSVIYIDKRGHRLYGRRAHDQGLISPENVAAGFKRLLGSSTPIEIKGAELTLSPEECAAEIIRQLLGQATTETGREDFSGVIITIPAAFNQMQAEATLRAAKLAGLEKIDLLQEPVAAALTAMTDAERSGKFVIYDFGGGTFDVALAQAVKGEVNIVAHQGVNMLGGRDFDRRIVNDVIRPWLIANFDLPEDFQRDKNYQRLLRVAQLAAEKAKIDLTVKEETNIFASDDEVRLMDQSETEIFLDIPFTRSRFEELIRQPVIQTISVIKTLMEENNWSASDIDRIVFIGGPSRIPLVRKLVTEELGIAPDLGSDPMTAVAVGAAHYAEGRVWDRGQQSAPKPTQAQVAPLPQEPDLLFEYMQRTPDEKTILTVHVAKTAPSKRQIRLTTEGWDSSLLPMTDGLTILVPLKTMGPNVFEATILDENGAVTGSPQSLTVTRVVATTGGIPAAQTIAVKVLSGQGSSRNILHPLVNKGVILPTNGQTHFAAARELKAGGGGSISFELFQVEYPERVELNLCVGMFRIGSDDLPLGTTIKAGDPIVFDWKISESGILQASVKLPNNDNAPLELTTPRFYAPQAGEISFAAENGHQFASAILLQGEEEWGDLTAALGPEGGSEVQLLHTRLIEQSEILEESDDDAEAIRHIVEEARFIRQDIARLSKKYKSSMLQRRLGKMCAVFNRIARAGASQEEVARFDHHMARVQQIIEEGNVALFENADIRLGEMRDLFFSIAWRDTAYVKAWFKTLSGQEYFFPDATEFAAMVSKGQRCAAEDDVKGLREVVSQMLTARITVGVNDSASEPATIVKS